VYFVEHQTEKPEDTSVLSCTKKISKENGQDIWAFFCSIINFSVQVKKFMIPMLDGIAESIKSNFDGDFITFVNSSIFSKKNLLTNFKWEWIDKRGEAHKQKGWSYHRILKTYQLIYILQTLKVILTQSHSFKHHAKKLYQESKNFSRKSSREIHRRDAKLYKIATKNSQR
jgi:hypothetical protein